MQLAPIKGASKITRERKKDETPHLPPGLLHYGTHYSKSSDLAFNEIL